MNPETNTPIPQNETTPPVRRSKPRSSGGPIVKKTTQGMVPCDASTSIRRLMRAGRQMRKVTPAVA